MAFAAQEICRGSKDCPSLSLLKDVGKDKHLRSRDEEVDLTGGRVSDNPGYVLRPCGSGEQSEIGRTALSRCI